MTLCQAVFQLIRGIEASESAWKVRFARVTSDSREAGPDVAFVAVKGTRVDGHSFIHMAVDAGAGLVIGEAIPEGLSCPWVKVPDSRLALSLLAAACAGDPTGRFILTGVTGTDGKTSTAMLTEAGFAACGHVTGLVGTVMYRYAGVQEPAPLTTPDPLRLQALFARMTASGVGAAVMEVSSHALDQRRADGCHLDCGVFTNLTRDHLDYHETPEAYEAAKMRLFTEVLPANVEARGAVANADDAMTPRIVKACPLPVVTFSLEAGKGDIHPLDVDFSLDGIRARLATPWGEVSLDSGLVGRHNLSNMMAAFGVGGVMEQPLDRFLGGVSGVSCIPGRLERVTGARPITTFVDYAHTPKALEYVLGVLRELVDESRIVVVMGAGGDRDRGKRPLMGRAAVTLADRVVVTSDNPRTEDPEAIIEEIMVGVKQAEREGVPVAPCDVEPDRRNAIGRALDVAEDGDVVLIAGKGHEDYQEVGTVRTHFSDVEVAGDFLQRI